MDRLVTVASILRLVWSLYVVLTFWTMINKPIPDRQSVRLTWRGYAWGCILSVAGFIMCGRCFGWW